MVGVRKLIEKIFSQEELAQLDDKMPEFTLRKKEDQRKRRESMAIQDNEDDDEVGPLRAIATKAHLHIPMASGNVMKVPLPQVDISQELNKTACWKHIESKASLEGAPHYAYVVLILFFYYNCLF